MQERIIICFSNLFDTGNEKEVVYGFNVIERRYMYQLMSTVQLPVSKRFEKHIIMRSCTQKKDVSLATEFQKNISKLS